MIHRSFCAIAFALLVCTGCGPTPFYEEYVEIPAEGWYADSTIRFVVEIEDTSRYYNIFVNLRNNGSYPYRNIYLFRQIESNHKVEYSDTVQYILADPYGKWLGEGLGDLKTHQLTFNRQAVKFRRPGEYHFSIQQGMRMEPLPGIEDVGLTIFISENKQQTDG